MEMIKMNTNPSIPICIHYKLMSHSYKLIFVHNNEKNIQKNKNIKQLKRILRQFRKNIENAFQLT